MEVFAAVAVLAIFGGGLYWFLKSRVNREDKGSSTGSKSRTPRRPINKR